MICWSRKYKLNLNTKNQIKGILTAVFPNGTKSWSYAKFFGIPSLERTPPPLACWLMKRESIG